LLRTGHASCLGSSGMRAYVSIGLVLLLGACSVPPDDGGEAESTADDLTSSCAGDFELTSFLEIPGATTGTGRSGTSSRTWLLDTDGDGAIDIVHVSPGASSNPYTMGAPMTFDVSILRQQGGTFVHERSQLEGHHAEALYA